MRPRACSATMRQELLRESNLANFDKEALCRNMLADVARRTFCFDDCDMSFH